MKSASDPLPVGSVLRDRFELLEVIGRGGICTVYRAVDRTRLIARADDPEVAIKLVMIQGVQAAWAIERIHREARYLRELRHPNIVEVFDSDYTGAFHFIVLELLTGRTLADVLRAQPGKALPLHLVVRITSSVGAALIHAHRFGVTHRDIKPNNVIVTADGAVKLLDFGSASSLDPDDEDENWVQTLGNYDAMTPLFASREMINGDGPAESDDVFSLAVLAYVMLTGTHPFGGASATEVTTKGLLIERPRTLSRRRWRALEEALHLERFGRTQTVAAFIQDFAHPLWRDRLMG